MFGKDGKTDVESVETAEIIDLSGEVETEKTGRKAVAFVNYEIPTKGDAKNIRSPKGFPIWQDEKYPNKCEDLLVQLAEDNGGVAVVNLRCRIVLNRPAQALDADSVELAVAEG